MLKKGLGLLIFILLITSLGAQPKVAVLDAVLGEGVPVNASAIVADAINEQFVKTPEYTAIDRVHISSVLEEMKFQLSGNVKQEDIKEIGVTFGADYLCVANVSLLGSTYTVSARLIEVRTAEVFLQESHRMKGETDILFLIAEIVGAELVGADLASVVSVPYEASDAEIEPGPQSETPVEETADAQSEILSKETPLQDEGNRFKPRAPRSHLMVSLLFPSYYGLDDYVYDSSPEGFYSISGMNDFLENNGFSGVDTRNFGIDVHYMEPYIKFLNFSLGFTFIQQTLAAESGGESYEWENFRIFEPYAGIGAAFSPTSYAQIYGGMTFGLLVLSLGSAYEGDADEAFWGDRSENSAAGMTLGFEVGVNFYRGPFGLDLRYRLSRCSELTGDDFFQEDNGDNRSFGHQGFMIGLGFVF